MIVETKTRAVMMAVLLMTLPPLVKGEQQAFNPDSIEQIEARYSGEPFLLVIWEINCVPCREELSLLGDLIQTHPDMNLSLIATDDIRYKSEIIRILETNQLAGVDSWIFADPNVERLRY
ncbi:MAG: TlpA family protein disulfide reductase, partial [Gammaproteobacteria bacterium]